METVSLKMEKRQVGLLKRHAKILGRSQAAVIRELIDKHLGGQRKPSLLEQGKDLCGSVRASRDLSTRRLTGYGQS
ncbi:MAG TPA: hypothetical protein VHH88_01370 [Verrucomicrobiae bacterium]|nr:hypothetical protein [Verrucomicrobiae bacterium]